MIRHPFNVWRAIDGEPIISRNGHQVKFINYVSELPPAERILILHFEEFSNCVCFHNEEGKINYMGDNQPGDVFMEVKK